MGRYGGKMGMRKGVTEEVGKEMRVINRNVEYASSSNLLLLDF